MDCKKCKLQIRGETGIRCAGVCGKVYHSQSKCSGIDQYTLGKLDEFPNLRYMCDECVIYISNVDLAIREVQSVVGKNGSRLLEYKYEFESALKTNEKEIKKLLEVIEAKYSERIGAMQKAQEVCERSVREMQKIRETTVSFNEQSDKICKELQKTREENSKIHNEIKVSKNASKINDNGQLPYAAVLKNNIALKSVMPDLRKDAQLVVKPKSKQKSEKTKLDLTAKVDPGNLKISNIESRRNGVIVIEAENENEREKIKKTIEENIGESYDIKIPKTIRPRFMISLMGYKHDEKSLVEKLKKQNIVLEHSEIKLVKMYEVKKESRLLYNAILEIDPETFPHVLNCEKINIGWERCKVFDSVEIMRCFKCQGYNHKAADCKNEEVCYKCFEQHRSKECNKVSIQKCINCIRANKKLNLGVDVNHLTQSKGCPVYLNKVEMRRKNIGY